ncbi:MAG: hypothetical protein AMK73_07450 [Planctomycetes bacterium SM23_32]|nr:MAG: hypothetical protein AMK73_07450 [Planctomycetes bacterium SM23_32]
MVSAQELPRWRGFNLVSKMSVRRNLRFPEDDFRLMRDWGFDFARLPMDYRCWLKDEDPRKLNESVLAEIDEAVEFGRKYGIHTCINFHRAPGYTVAQPPEKMSVWTDDEARELCTLHWRAFAERYAGLPSEEVTFNLFNEPARLGEDGFTLAGYREVVQLLTDAIWQEDPDRVVICDGYEYGRIPVQELTDLGVAQSTRAYEPHWLSHYKAHWMRVPEDFPPPRWPGGPADQPDLHWDIGNLREYWRPWKQLADSGVGVHCGEGGCLHTVPHPTALAWLEDALTVLAEYGFGWALWNLSGAFGIMDSGRTDVEYERFEGHKLDRQMLEVLLRH